MFIVNFHAFINYLAKLLYLLNSLPIFLFHLFHYFQWSMLFAEYPMNFLPFLPFKLHTVVIPPGTFYMEGDLTFRRLAL